jgi:hypothetical protein
MIGEKKKPTRGWSHESRRKKDKRAPPRKNMVLNKGIFQTSENFYGLVIAVCLPSFPCRALGFTVVSCPDPPLDWGWRRRDADNLSHLADNFPD